jgi:predicted kinase
MPKCIILSGIPCSGKSTWAKKQKLPILSCDKLRFKYFCYSNKYVFDPKVENEIWEDFYFRLNLLNRDVIIDNTNCRLSYINKIKLTLNPVLKWDIEIKRFDCPLYKAYYRNIIRWITTGKFIPFKVIKNMKTNYDKLWNIKT